MAKSELNSVDRRFIRNTVDEFEYRLDRSATNDDKIIMSASLANAIVAGLERIGE